MRPKLDPKDIAFIVIYAVNNHCYNKEIRYSETKNMSAYIECLANNLQNELEDLIDIYLLDTLDENDLREIWKNVDDEFRELIKKEYENSRWEYLATIISSELNDFPEKWLRSIDENSNLDNDEKILLFEKYKVSLEELKDVITKALKTQEPLSRDELKRYLLELYKIAGFRYANPYDLITINYYMQYYDILNKAGKLKLLDRLLTVINDELHYVENAIKEYRGMSLELS